MVTLNQDKLSEQIAELRRQWLSRESEEGGFYDNPLYSIGEELERRLLDSDGDYFDLTDTAWVSLSDMFREATNEALDNGIEEQSLFGCMFDVLASSSFNLGVKLALRFPEQFAKSVDEEETYNQNRDRTEATITLEKI